MYTLDEREEYFQQAIDFFSSSELFEGVVQIGSGSIGYKDEYSDVDLMVGIKNKDDILPAKSALSEFFKNFGEVYINERFFTKTILGFSIFLKNGLSFDISFGPTDELIVCSPQWKIVLDKTGKLTERMEQANIKFINSSKNYGVDNNINLKFVYALRSCNIALKRKNYIYAVKMLDEARQCILDIQVLNEGKKLHQFKAYNELNSDFLVEIMSTYPSCISEREILLAMENTKALYFKTLESNKDLSFDKNLLIVLAE